MLLISDKWDKTRSALCKLLKLPLKRERKLSCHGLNVCIYPKVLCWNLNAPCESMRRWGLWEVLRSCESGALTKISPLIKETSQSFFNLPPREGGHSERVASATWRRALTRAWPCSWTSIFQNGLPDSRMGRNKYCCLEGTQSLAFCYSSSDRLKHFP